MKATIYSVMFISIFISLFTLSCGASDGGGSEADVRFRSGVDLQEQGRLEEAIAAYDEAIHLDPKLASTSSVYNNRGRSNAGLGRYEKAIQDLD